MSSMNRTDFNKRRLTEGLANGSVQVNGRSFGIPPNPLVNTPTGVPVMATGVTANEYSVANPMAGFAEGGSVVVRLSAIPQTPSDSVEEKWVRDGYIGVYMNPETKARSFAIIGAKFEGAEVSIPFYMERDDYFPDPSEDGGSIKLGRTSDGRTRVFIFANSILMKRINELKNSDWSADVFNRLTDDGFVAETPNPDHATEAGTLVGMIPIEEPTSAFLNARGITGDDVISRFPHSHFTVASYAPKEVKVTSDAPSFLAAMLAVGAGAYIGNKIALSQERKRK